MELNFSHTQRFDLPETFLREFYYKEVPKSFVPSFAERYFGEGESPTLFTVDLFRTLAWLHEHELPRPFELEVCDIPVLLFAPEFSTSHLLFHFDGSSNSSDLIRRFVFLFRNLIQDVKATIISPSFIPKSKIREEQEIIQLVASVTRETSFIKFNFTGVIDFWGYAVAHSCTLLVTSKTYQEDLAKVLLQLYKGGNWSPPLSFYLSV